MKDDELWFKTRFTIIWLPFWGDETQHAASLQLETKLGEKSKLTSLAKYDMIQIYFIRNLQLKERV